MDKENVVCTHAVECNSAIKNVGNPIICNIMDEPGAHYAKWNRIRTEKDKYSMI